MPLRANKSPRRWGQMMAADHWQQSMPRMHVDDVYTNRRTHVTKAIGRHFFTSPRLRGVVLFGAPCILQLLSASSVCVGELVCGYITDLNRKQN